MSNYWINKVSCSLYVRKTVQYIGSRQCCVFMFSLCFPQTLSWLKDSVAMATQMCSLDGPNGFDAAKRRQASLEQEILSNRARIELVKKVRAAGRVCVCVCVSADHGLLANSENNRPTPIIGIAIYFFNRARLTIAWGDEGALTQTAQLSY